MRLPQSADLLYSQLVALSGKAKRTWAADHTSAAVAVRDGEVDVGELAEATQRFARGVQAAGIAAEDWCVVRLEKPLDVLVAVCGLTAVGAVPVLLSPGLEADAAHTALKTVPHSMHLLVARARAEEFPDALAVDAARLVWEDVWEQDGEADAATDTDALPQHGVERSPDSPYLVTHTSGTTGVPKLAVHTRASFYQQSVIQTRMLRLLRLRGYAAFATSPVHIRTLSALLTGITAGVSLLILGSEQPDSVREQLERWRPEYLETHPNTFVTWEDLADAGAMSSVRVFLATFDATHPRTVDRLLAGSRRRLAVFMEVYAQSEVGPIAFHVRTRRRRRGGVETELAGHRVGHAIPGYAAIRVVDENGTAVPRGQAGRIQVRAKGRFAGYLNFPEKFTQNLFEERWWDTGDWGSLGRGGTLRLLDRQVERLEGAPSGIALEDVLLSRIPDLAEVVVLETEEGLLPVIAGRPGAEPVGPEEWSAATGDMPALAAPLSVAWEEIPRTATGKVRREVLRGRLADMER
ncbi:long-chain fatty acid--CoA ligase [Streptomyces sp. WAC 06738]|uniref:class I adenylate-forming enzyme family protein n=1 Tax=Streptomyces sp. WAC 06738 TaxID=2203210 RepID=UPI000F6B408A|nr:class I adenylate-forming enzyme family protein [Streptomyces sp. WAC 06738]AZM50208.1 long-chain fatty acid--CoA ligase [Streptomyces sp. WAC 06738]